MATGDSALKEFPNGTILVGERWLPSRDLILRPKRIETIDGKSITQEDAFHFRASIDLGKGYYEDYPVNRLARFLDIKPEAPVEGYAHPFEPDSVPFDVIGYSKPATAAYLRAVMLLSRGFVSKLLDVSEDTVDQYVSDVLNGERE